METLRAFIVANPILAASLSSLWGAVLIDLTTFVRSKSPGDFFGQFAWQIAAWRYVQAIVAGFIGNVAIAGAGTLVALYLLS